MLQFFDYLFFLTYRYYRQKGSDIPVDRGIQLISLVQIFLIADFIMVVDFFGDLLSLIDAKYKNKYVLGLPLALIVILINDVRYKRLNKKTQFAGFYKKWGDNPTTKKQGLFLIGLPTFLLFGVPVFLWCIRQLLY